MASENNKHTIADLYQMQALPLSAKIRMTEYRIRQWVDEYGEDGVYVSFSGGKDSTVLLDIVRNRLGYKNIPAVFVDTGLEYPEIREFVKTFDNVEWLKPKMNFKEVIEKYGYPFISKEVSERVDGARKYIQNLLDRQTDRQTDKIKYAAFMTDLLGIDRRINKENPYYLLLKRGYEIDLEHATTRFQQLMGEYKRKDGTKGGFNYSKYLPFIDAPFNLSAQCCNVMKKRPVHKYSKETGRKPMTGQQASESRLRTTQWLKNGCNGFQMKSPISNPLSFWTEQDILLYIKEFSIPICSVYGEIIEVPTDKSKAKSSDNTLESGIFDLDRPLLKTTGCSRTGCMFCGYGCHLEKNEGRFERMRETHPKIYDYIMRPKEEGGLNYKEIIDWINKTFNFNIKY